MTVIVVIGALVTLAIPKFQVFMIKAKQSEVQSNLHLIDALSKTYLSIDNWPNGSNSSSGGYMTQLTLNSATACDVTPTTTDNLIGFHVGNCAKTRYYYYGWVEPNGQRYHWEGGSRNNTVCKSTTPTADYTDVWYIYSTDGKLCNLHDAVKGNCTSARDISASTYTGYANCYRIPWY